MVNGQDLHTTLTHIVAYKSTTNVKDSRSYLSIGTNLLSRFIERLENYILKVLLLKMIECKNMRVTDENNQYDLNVPKRIYAFKECDLICISFHFSIRGVKVSNKRNNNSSSSTSD